MGCDPPLIYCRRLIGVGPALAQSGGGGRCADCSGRGRWEQGCSEPVRLQSRAILGVESFALPEGNPLRIVAIRDRPFTRASMSESYY